MVHERITAVITDFVNKRIQNNPTSFKFVVVIMIIGTTILCLSQSLSSGILYEAF